jgi:DNA helicase II / ATP-dependent DNA helicase PcrA
VTAESLAEQASAVALQSVRECIEDSRHFRLEAGAGAGKTYSLVEALKQLTRDRGVELRRNMQQIACITFTNVARDEILARTDRSPLIYSETNHAFCWSLIAPFQKWLRPLLDSSPDWQDRLADFGGTVGNRSVDYNLGYRAVRESEVSIGHDDVVSLCIHLLEEPKFRQMVASRFPIILIDEYQDTDAEWVEAIKKHFLHLNSAPLFGFFGDHWQKIYGDGCGKLEHPNVVEIGKRANFRSVEVVVKCLNRMRPELPQFVEDPALPGEVRVLHTNGWSGLRQKGAHYGGDLPPEETKRILEKIKLELESAGWDLSQEKTKILMLTHKSLASEQGYTSLAQCFDYNDSYLKKESPYISFLVDVLEPVCDAFQAKKFGLMLSLMSVGDRLVGKAADKKEWTDALNGILAVRETGSVGEVISHLQLTGRPALGEKIQKLEAELIAFDRSSGVEMPRGVREAEALKKVPYREVKALRRYLEGFSPFETKHGVKGAEFENVVVVLGRGWNKYNYNTMLEFAAKTVPADKKEFFENNRNLFYVCCSRPRKRLCLLFTQELTSTALGQLTAWFGPESIAETS